MDFYYTKDKSDPRKEKPFFPSDIGIEMAIVFGDVEGKVFIKYFEKGRKKLLFRRPQSQIKFIC